MIADAPNESEITPITAYPFVSESAPLVIPIFLINSFKMGVKKYFKREFHWSMLSLEHDNAADFYLSCWQLNRSCVPLLCLRGVLCAGAVATVVASMVLLTGILSGFGYWWIYLTHWGVIANALTTAFAFGISLRVFLRGPFDATFGLPWYVKVYWFLYNASVSVAFLITIFYWSFVHSLDFMEDLDPTLDVFLHGMNSVVMFLLLATHRHPTRLLHCLHGVSFGLLYLAFSLIYYFAGGTDPTGDVAVYPMVNWSNPGPTAVVAVLVALGIVMLHCFVVLLTLGRDYLSRRCLKDDRSFSVSGF